MTVAPTDLGPGDTGRFAALARRSIEIVLSNQAPTGAYLASPNFSVYHYSWLRDGAFIADALSRAGHSESAALFFDWCRGVIEARIDRIDDLVLRHLQGEPISQDELLHTRYTTDGKEAQGEWTNHQLDGYGAWLWGLDRHLSRSTERDNPGLVERFTPAVQATASYLNAFWSLPCYDCWEEYPNQVHVATLAAVAAGLRVAAKWPTIPPAVQAKSTEAVAEIDVVVRQQGVRDGHLVKWLGGRDVDASLLFCAIPYGMFAPDDPLMAATNAEISRQLVHGGTYRHANDTYFGGGEWVLLTALHGSYLAAIGDREGALAKLRWIADQASDDGWLPEQVSDELLYPDRFDEWTQKWGPVASPLLWSHAMYLNLYRELCNER